MIPNTPPLRENGPDISRKAHTRQVWGVPKIHGELLKLGIAVSERTVSGLLRRHKRKPPSQTWRTFIKNHMPDMVGVDFLVVPTIRFQMLFVFVILSHAGVASLTST